MRRSSIAGWIALAILGLAVAAAVSLAASRISSQRIGLASEPLTAGDRLAPRTTATSSTPTTTQTTPATTGTSTSTTPSGTTTDGSSGRGRGRGDGDHDSDDD